MFTIILRRRYGRYMARAFMIAALIALMTGCSQAVTASPAPASGASGYPDPSTTPLIQCNVGLILPLLLAGLVSLYGRSRKKE